MEKWLRSEKEKNANNLGELITRYGNDLEKSLTKTLSDIFLKLELANWHLVEADRTEDGAVYITAETIESILNDYQMYCCAAKNDLDENEPYWLAIGLRTSIAVNEYDNEPFRNDLKKFAGYIRRSELFPTHNAGFNWFHKKAAKPAGDNLSELNESAYKRKKTIKFRLAIGALLVVIFLMLPPAMAACFQLPIGYSYVVLLAGAAFLPAAGMFFLGIAVNDSALYGKSGLIAIAIYFVWHYHGSFDFSKGMDSYYFYGLAIAGMLLGDGAVASFIFAWSVADDEKKERMALEAKQVEEQREAERICSMQMRREYLLSTYGENAIAVIVEHVNQQNSIAGNVIKEATHKLELGDIESAERLIFGIQFNEIQACLSDLDLVLDCNDIAYPVAQRLKEDIALVIKKRASCACNLGGANEFLLPFKAAVKTFQELDRATRRQLPD